MEIFANVISLLLAFSIPALLVATVATQGSQRQRVLRIATAVLAVQGGILFLLAGAIGVFFVAFGFVFSVFSNPSSFQQGWIPVVLGLFIAGGVGIGGGFTARHSPRRGQRMMLVATVYYVGVIVAATLTLKADMGNDPNPLFDLEFFVLSIVPAIYFIFAVLASNWAERIVSESSLPSETPHYQADAAEIV